MHNDYISGGRDLASRLGADLVLPAASGAAFAFEPAFHGEDIEGASGATIRPLHTPGHTPEHTSYLLLSTDNRGPCSPEAACSSARPDDPTSSGPSSLDNSHVCSSGSAEVGCPSRRDQGSSRPTAKVRSARLLVRGAPPPPSGRRRPRTRSIGSPMPRLSPTTSCRRSSHIPPTTPKWAPPTSGTPRHSPPSVPDNLTPDEAAELIESGAAVLDGRNREAFASAHLPGSLGIELGDSFAPWAGWLLDYNAPVLLVLEDSDDAKMAATELARIGFTDVRGVLRGTEGWVDSGRTVSRHRTAAFQDLAQELAGGAAIQVLDVRDPMEWEAGHLDGSAHCYVPDLLDGIPDAVDPSRPVWLICRTGNRASIAAGLLQDSGVEPVVVTRGGVPDLLVASTV